MFCRDLRLVCSFRKLFSVAFGSGSSCSPHAAQPLALRIYPRKHGCPQVWRGHLLSLSSREAVNLPALQRGADAPQVLGHVLKALIRGRVASVQAREVGHLGKHGEWVSESKTPWNTLQVSKTVLNILQSIKNKS